MKRWALVVLAACTAGLVYAAIWRPLGTRFALGDWPVPSGTPWTYQLESGFIPALTVLSLVTFLAGAWHHVNCHQDGCWRIGKHKVDGSPWCGKHHEDARRNAAATLDDVVAKLDTIAGLLGGRRLR